MNTSTSAGPASDPKLYRVAVDGQEIGEMTVDEMLEATLAHTLAEDARYFHQATNRWEPVARIVTPLIDAFRAQRRAAASPGVVARPAERWSAFQRGVLIGCGVLFCGFLIWCFAVAAPLPTSRAPGDRETKRAAERMIFERLKAPSTAKFSPSSETQVIRTSDGTYAVIGWVDAQNGFGAQLRSDYSVLLRHRGGNEWEEVSVAVEPR